MMSKIELSIDEVLLAKAQAFAAAQGTTLEALFHGWLTEYAAGLDRVEDYDELMARLGGRIDAGRKFTRDEMNERR